MNDAWEAQQRFNEAAARQLATMAPGNPHGRIASAAPPAAAPPRTEIYRTSGPESVVFSSLTPAAPTTTASGPFVPRRSHQTLNVIIARATGTSAMTCTLYKNGVSIGTVTTTASGLIANGTITSSFSPLTDVLTVALTTVGSGTTAPTVEVEMV